MNLAVLLRTIYYSSVHRWCGLFICDLRQHLIYLRTFSMINVHLELPDPPASLLQACTNMPSSPPPPMCIVCACEHLCVCAYVHEYIYVFACVFIWRTELMLNVLLLSLFILDSEARFLTKPSQQDQGILLSSTPLTPIHQHWRQKTASMLIFPVSAGTKLWSSCFHKHLFTGPPLQPSVPLSFCPPSPFSFLPSLPLSFLFPSSPPFFLQSLLPSFFLPLLPLFLPPSFFSFITIFFLLFSFLLSSLLFLPSFLSACLSFMHHFTI